MTNEMRHRIWAFATLSWLALIALPTTVAAIQWQRGIGRDPDMSGVLELILFLSVLSAFPAALVAFGLLSPLAIAVDRAARGRTTRAANVLIGAALGVSAMVLYGAGTGLLRLMSGSLDQPIREILWRRMHDPATAAIVAMFVGSGMVVGLGLRRRGERVGAA